MTQTLAHPCITLRAVGVKLTVGPAADSSVPGLSRMGIVVIWAVMPHTIFIRDG